MSVGYILINNTKKESILFNHIDASTVHELTGNSVASAIVTWYLIKNSGDEIGFVPDHYEDSAKEWPFKNVLANDINNYPDITDRVIDKLIEEGIFKDHGKDIFDKDEPEIYLRKLENIWEI